MLTYRQLDTSEWHLIRPYFEERHVPLPPTQLSTIFGAFDEGGHLDAFLVCQFKLHTEPLLSHNPMAVPGLIGCARQYLLSLGMGGIECFTAASDGRVRELAWQFGFRPAEVMFVMRLGERQSEAAAEMHAS